MNERNEKQIEGIKTRTITDKQETEPHRACRRNCTQEKRQNRATSIHEKTAQNP